MPLLTCIHVFGRGAKNMFCNVGGSTNTRGESRAKVAYEISRISEIPQNFEGISGFLVGFPWICGISNV